MKILKYFVIFVAALSLLSCEGASLNARDKGILTGGAIGAGLGAIVGNQVGDTGAGIAIGSALGGLSGGLVGNSMDSRDRDLEERGARLDAQQRELEENRRIIDELRSRGADVRTTDRGVVVSLPDVLFEFDSARLTSQAEHTARDIAEVVNKAGHRHIAIEGHTDSVGTVEYNQRLSLARARSVADGLTANGVSPSRIATKGFGESRPIASNSSDEGRRRNRRVEVVIENQ